MSKANAKAANDKAQEAAAQAADTATSGGAAAMVPAAAPTATKPDKHTGKGGLYTRINGVRTLVERTQQPTTEKE